MAITPIGNTVALTPAGSATANVANVRTGTNTFHFANASTTVNVYVGVFNDYASAAAMDHPTSVGSGGGVILTPNESMVIQGNFGTNPNPDTVYVSAITATGSTSVFATPVAPGSAG